MVFESEFKVITEQFNFLEGPVWHPDGFLLFSDIPENVIYKLDGSDVTIWRKNSGNSNGLTMNRNQQLIACEHGNRQVSITTLDGQIQTLVDQFEGKKLNSPNDCVGRSDGMIYFTDPPYGIDENQKELHFHGVCCVKAGQGLKLLLQDYDRPNGLAFTPDESYLYIADTSREWVKIHKVESDGSLQEGTIFARVGRPDGLKVDVKGNLYVASSEGVVVFNSNGDRIDQLELPQRPANLAFGDHDYKTLFIAARTGLYNVRVNNSGIAPFSSLVIV